ncbi:restriction endonuclease subunit S [Teredinibacter sp. KSP-S5-2]|uniref:restriction endonuclease subunit S n=1 Tax=Teredinibacter sp. KSP-S5-2 TaxID=3034506 RepID=UPI00293427A0|nr:restriction endonuclease subunit S [Teredinibacter sp. KSP-S5-2]WNO07773.1 restriction endonuclease subunit S [Teredinibacter sp. KSP-S5-2]
MLTQLKNLAHIRNGYTFREKINESANGNVHVLQIKDLRKQLIEHKQNQLMAHRLPRINWHGNHKTLLPPNSIVVPARGDHYQSAYFLGNTGVLPTSHILVVTIKKKQVNPAYLCWAVNQPGAQHFLYTESRGTKIPRLSKNSLGLLTIQLPPIEVQEKIIHIQQLWEKEQCSQKNLQKNREKQIHGVFNTLLDIKNTPE